MTPEELATKELERLKESDQLKFPIDPFKLLKDSGVIVFLKSFDRLDGIIINDNDNCTVVGINNNCNYQRQRFTAAHEYCHYIHDLKREEGSSDIIECIKQSNKSIEKYANDFAGYLLMPTEELKKVCDEYKNADGYIDFDSVTIIAEYFGVSFASCLNRIAYGLGLIEGDISKESLIERRKNYRVNEKRKELIKTTIDSKLLNNMISSISFMMTDFNSFNGQKFLQDYIYNDNKLEGVVVDRNQLNYMLADLNYNGTESEFFDNDSEEVVMTLGNLELQTYVINTTDVVSIKKCKYLHSLLYKYVPYPDDNGKYRTGTAIIRGAAIQPVNASEIAEKIDQLDDELQFFLENIDEYDIGDYIEQVAYFTYKFIIIHPFTDGNGRVSRAILNWLLRLKNIPPIYIDSNCRDEYYDVLRKMDIESDPIPLIMFIEKRIINTMLSLNKYSFIDEIEETNTEEEASIDGN